MSRTDLDPKTLAKSLRRMCGDGSMEWVTEPMQTSVLLDIADMLDENAKLRKACADLLHMAESNDPEWPHWPEMHEHLRDLGIEVES